LSTQSEKHSDSFLGTGWSFPPSFDERSGAVNLVSHEEDIQQSLNIILSTTPGERLLHPGFGCDIKKMVFETINESVITRIKDAIERAILFFEPRITLEEVVVDTEDSREKPNSIYDGVMKIELIYTIRQTNTRSNMVYPFYFAEADGSA
jgi:phage baseplate assembly protein W